MTVLIYKIAYADHWLEGLRSEAFEGTAKDCEDGFIHFSTGEQLTETLRLHYSRSERALALSAVDADVLGEALRWEPSRNGDLFPHLYAPLPNTAVRRTVVGFYPSLADDGFRTVRTFIAGADVSADPAPKP